MYTPKDLRIRKLAFMLMCVVLLGPGPYSIAQQSDASEPQNSFYMSIEEIMEVSVAIK